MVRLLEVYFIIYSALSTPPYFLLYVLWKLLKGLQKHISFENLHGCCSRSFRHRHRHFVNPLQRNLLYCAARFANLEWILDFSVPSIMHFSGDEVNANHNVTCSPRVAENDSDCSRIAKEIAIMSGFFVEGRRQTLLYSCK